MNTHCKVDSRSRPGGVQQSCELPIWDFQALGLPFIIQPKQGGDHLANTQTVADKKGMNIFLLLLHSFPNNGNEEFPGRLPGAIP